MSTSEPLVVRGACHHDCPDTCLWDATVVDGRAVRLRGNAEHPTTRGQLCPKVNRFLDRVYHPDRILRPLRRAGPKGSGRYEEIGWPEAIDEIAERLTATMAGPGAESILQYSFDGTQGLIQKGILADRFFNAVGASDIRRHLCGVTAWLGASDVSGLPFGIDPEDLEHAQSIILWGTNNPADEPTPLADDRAGSQPRRRDHPHRPDPNGHRGQGRPPPEDQTRH